MSCNHRAVVPARLVAGALLSLLPLSAQAQAGFSIRGLSGFGVDTYRHVRSLGLALNTRGQVAGYSGQYNAKHVSLGNAAFLERNGNLQNLGNFGTNSSGAGNSVANGINDNGQIAGYSFVFDAMHNSLGTAAFLWQNGTLTNLGNFGTDANGGTSVQAQGINNLGQVCGFSNVYNNQHTSIGNAAFLWQSGKGLTNLGNFGTDGTGYGYSTGYGINNLSQVVGYSQVYDALHNSLGTAAFLWQNGTLTNLGNLGTSSVNGPGYSYAYGVNNLSQVVGTSYYYDTNNVGYGARAFFYDFQQTKTMTALPTLGTDKTGYGSAAAKGINDRGWIVGNSNRYDNSGNYIEQDAVLWPNVNTIINLNDYLPAGSGWTLTQALAINNRGQITGWGTHNGATEAFLLTPYVVGDFTRDGNPDILFQNSASGDMGLAVLFGTTRIDSLAPANGVPLQWKVAANPDLNGDGYADIVWQNSQTGDVAYWLLNNGRYVDYGYIYYGLPLNWKVVGSGDFNGDSYPDLVLQDTQAGTIAIWYMAGGVYYDYGLIQSPGPDWQVVGAGDMNGDGQPDLLLRHKTNGDLYVWLLNGLTVSQGVFIANVPLEWNMVGLGDFGGDGNTSLLWQNSKSNDLYYWLMSGTTNVGSGLIQSGVPGWQVVGPK